MTDEYLQSLLNVNNKGNNISRKQNRYERYIIPAVETTVRRRSSHYGFIHIIRTEVSQ